MMIIVNFKKRSRLANVGTSMDQVEQNLVQLADQVEVDQRDVKAKINLHNILAVLATKLDSDSSMFVPVEIEFIDSTDDENPKMGTELKQRLQIFLLVMTPLPMNVQEM